MYESVTSSPWVKRMVLAALLAPTKMSDTPSPLKSPNAPNELPKPSLAEAELVSRM